MIRQNKPSIYCRLLLLYIFGLNFRVGFSEEETCQLSILIPFRDDRIIAAENSSTVISTEDTHRDGLMLLTTALLAIHDFNNRESSLAPDALKGIQDACTIQFPPPIITDSKQSATFIRSTTSSWRPSPVSTCSFVVGPANNIVADVVGQSVYANNGTIAISYGADANRLAEDSFLYPNMALANIKWEDYARSLMQYVKSSGRNTVGVLLTPEDNLDFDDNDFLPMWTKASQDSGITIKSLSRIAYRSRSILEERLLTLRDERGVRTILVTLHRDDELELLAEVADSLGMLTSEYKWIMTEHFLSSRYVASYGDIRTDSSLYRLFRRTEIFEMLDGFSPYADESSSQLLQNEMLSKSAMLVESIQSIVKQTPGLDWLEVNQTTLEEAFFSNTPVVGASRLYDAILAGGLSACNGEVSMENFLQTAFDGVSGKFEYPTESRSLPASEFQFGVFSIQTTETMDCPRCLIGTATLRPNLIHRMNGGIQPEVDDLQTLSLGVRMYGIILSSLAMLFSICCGVFVYKYRKDRIVAIGQPEFLGLVCIGAFFVAIPVILISFDEASGWTTFSLSISCTVQVWLKYLGILVVNMALFSKLYRVEKVTQMRRGQQIQVKDVIKPFCGLFAAAFILLIVWTAVERPVWKREFGIGSCYESVYFGVAMDLIMIVAISMTLWWGHKTRELPEDISDSKRVYYTLVAQFILLMFDVLFSIFTRAIRSNTFAYVLDATYAAALSITCCLYLIVPKMYYVYVKSKTGELPPSLQRGTVRVTGIDVPTGAAGITGNARFQNNRSRALRASNSNNFTRSSAASGHFGTQSSFVNSRSSVEKSGFLSADGTTELSESAPEAPLGSPTPRRSTPPPANPYSTPLPTVLDCSLKSSGLGRDSEPGLDTSQMATSLGRDSLEIDPNSTYSPSVPSEDVWVQSVEECKSSPAQSPYSSGDLRMEA